MICDDVGTSSTTQPNPTQPNPMPGNICENYWHISDNYTPNTKSFSTGELQLQASTMGIMTTNDMLHHADIYRPKKLQEACWLYHSLQHYMDVCDSGSAPKFVYKHSMKSPFNLCEISGSHADEYQKTLNFFQPLLPSSSDGQ